MNLLCTVLKDHVEILAKSEEDSKDEVLYALEVEPYKGTEIGRGTVWLRYQFRGFLPDKGKSVYVFTGAFTDAEAKPSKTRAFSEQLYCRACGTRNRCDMSFRKWNNYVDGKWVKADYLQVRCRVCSCEWDMDCKEQ